MTGGELVEMYRLLGIAKYDERYVIPTAYTGEAHQLEELGCSLDVDGGPGMVGSGPFGEGSGRATPVSVETFHALRDRQTSDEVTDLDGPERGSTSSTGTARADRPGCSHPAPSRRTRNAATHEPGPVCTRARRRQLQAASICLQYPDDHLPGCCPSCAPRSRHRPVETRVTASRRSWPRPHMAPRTLAEHYVRLLLFDPPPVLPVPDLVERRGDAPAGQLARRVEVPLPGLRCRARQHRTARLPARRPRVRRHGRPRRRPHAPPGTPSRARAAPPGAARRRDALRGARSSCLRAPARAVPRRRRRGQGARPQRPTREQVGLELAPFGAIPAGGPR